MSLSIIFIFAHIEHDDLYINLVFLQERVQEPQVNGKM